MNTTKQIRSFKQLLCIAFAGLFILFAIKLTAQEKKNFQQYTIDSLLTVLKTAKDDTLKVSTLSTLSNQYYSVSDYEKAIEYATQQKTLAEKLNDKKGIAQACNHIGGVYNIQGNPSIALDNFFKALKIAEENHFKKIAAASYNNIGGIYRTYNDFQKALENHQKALDLYSEIKDKRGIAASYNNIGIAYKKMNDNDKALENYEKCLQIAQDLSKEAPDNMGYKSLISTALNNMGIIHYNKKEYKNALEKQMQALEIKKEANNKLGIASSYENIGNIYAKQHRFEDALNYLNTSIQMYKQLDGKSGLKEVYASLADVYIEKGDYKNALEYRKRYSQLQDSMVNEQSAKQIAEMNVRYESEKKDKELIKKDAEINRQQAETDNKKLQRNAFTIGFAFLLLLVFLIFRSYRQKLSINSQLEERNALIEKQKKTMEQKNVKITDSINYAYRIQQATLPSDKKIKELLPDSFVLFRPKDIVSGDFYWMKKLGTNTLIAAADCTGHGVPGAIMSLVYSNALNKTVDELGIKNPGEILNKVRDLIIETFAGKNRDVIHEGMDISIVNIDVKPDNTIKITWAGANNPLWILKKKENEFEFIEIKGDEQSVDRSGNAHMFTTHELQLNRGDVIFLFSDGYANLYEHTQGKEYGYKQLRELITANIHLPMDNLKAIVDSSIENSKHNLEQADDILVIGIKF